jgi:hypothetical protein
MKIKAFSLAADDKTPIFGYGQNNLCLFFLKVPPQIDPFAVDNPNSPTRRD